MNLASAVAQDWRPLLCAWARLRLQRVRVTASEAEGAPDILKQSKDKRNVSK